MTRRKLHVLVTGATGLLGGHVAQALRQHGHHVRALVRNPTAVKAEALRAHGVELWEGRLQDVDGVQKAAAGMDAVLLHSVPWEVGSPQEPALALGAARAVAQARVPHLVFLSAAGALEGSGFVVMESKGQIERGLMEVPMPRTVLAPAFLMDNFLAPLWFGGIADGRFPIPVGAQRNLQMVSARNVAQVAVLAMESPDRFVGRRLALASDHPTCMQAADILSRRCGRTVRHELFPLSQAQSLNPALAFLFRFLDERGHGVDEGSLQKEVPEVAWDTLEGWAAQQDWTVLDAAPPPPAHDHHHDHDH